MRADQFPDPNDRSGRRFGLFRRKGGKAKAKKRGRPAKPEGEAIKAIERFLSTREGVEAYVEPATPTNPLSVVLVAHDGEWMRQRIPDAAWLQRLSRVARIPVYEVRLVGYPQRMRSYRRKSSEDGPAD